MVLTYWRAFYLFQFKEGSKLPTTYAFALVEHTQPNLLRLRMYLAGEVIHMNEDAVKSERLVNMCSLITSSVKAVEKCLFSLKVIFQSARVSTL